MINARMRWRIFDLPSNREPVVFSGMDTYVLAGEDGCQASARTARTARAEDAYRGRQDIEVVLLGSDSIKTLERTHGHYVQRRDPHGRDV